MKVRDPWEQWRQWFQRVGWQEGWIGLVLHSVSLAMAKPNDIGSKGESEKLRKITSAAWFVLFSVVVRFYIPELMGVDSTSAANRVPT